MHLIFIESMVAGVFSIRRVSIGLYLRPVSDRIVYQTSSMRRTLIIFEYMISDKGHETFLLGTELKTNHPSIQTIKREL